MANRWEMEQNRRRGRTLDRHGASRVKVRPRCWPSDAMRLQLRKTGVSSTQLELAASGGNEISVGMGSGATVVVVGRSVTVHELASPGRHTNSRSENTNPRRQERSRARPSKQLTYLVQSSGCSILPRTMPRHMSPGSGYGSPSLRHVRWLPGTQVISSRSKIESTGQVSSVATSL
uniref:Uncharacterized protein n=1 Tax=Anopheles atroparvus TaxID=41427 RepID=A0A182INA4_ANOAO